MGSPSLTIRFVPIAEMYLECTATEFAWALDELPALYIGRPRRLSTNDAYFERARGRILRHRPATLGTVSRLFKEVPQ